MHINVVLTFVLGAALSRLVRKQRLRGRGRHRAALPPRGGGEGSTSRSGEAAAEARPPLGRDRELGALARKEKERVWPQPAKGVGGHDR